MFLKISQNLRENTCARVSFFNKVADLRPAVLLKRLWQLFSCELCEIFKNNFFTEPLRATASKGKTNRFQTLLRNQFKISQRCFQHNQGQNHFYREGNSNSLTWNPIICLNFQASLGIFSLPLIFITTR